MDRTVVLYAGAASYMSWCLDALRDVAAVEVWYTGPTPLPDHAVRPGVHRSDRIEVATGTDVMLVSGWFERRYLWTAWRARRAGCTTLILFDTQPRADLRWSIQSKLLGVLLRRIFHGAFVAGDRQRQVACDLGFSPGAVEIGMYACPISAGATDESRTRTFLWVGRLVPAKALEVMLDAFEQYRARGGDDPWRLLVVGDGDQRSLIEARAVDGVEHLGHLSPVQVTELMRTSGCLVSSSRVEPWGMVIAEAAAAAMPIICTDRAGASDHLVESGTSGHVVPADDASALAEAMISIAMVSAEQRAEMGRAGLRRAESFTPAQWVDRLSGLVGRCRR